MRTWFMIWMVCSVIVAVDDARRSAIEGDDRPWWGRAIMALLVGGVFAAVPGLLAVIARLP
jgi:uncharacterized membrane protein